MNEKNITLVVLFIAQLQQTNYYLAPEHFRIGLNNLIVGIKQS